MDAELLAFYAGTYDSYVKRTAHLVKKWRIGSQASTCSLETDLMVATMYFFLLERLGVTSYVLTDQQVTNIINQLLTTLNVTNVTNVTVTQIINQIYQGDTIYNIINQVVSPPPFTQNYTGVDTFSVTVTHNKGTTEVSVEVYENNGIEYVRIYPEIVIVDNNTVEVNFTSTSTGYITIFE